MFLEEALKAISNESNVIQDSFRRFGFENIKV